MTPAKLRELLGGIDIVLLDQVLRGRIAPGMRILDAGCGNGRNCTYFLRAGFEVWGVDQLQDAIASVRGGALALVPGYPAEERFVVATLDALPFSAARFDLVICNAVLHFARDEPQFRQWVGELWRVLAPGGLLFARLTGTMGIESLLAPAPDAAPGSRRYRLPDGSDRFCVDLALLGGMTAELGAELVDPIKTVNVQDRRAMTTWVLRKQ